MIKRIGVFFLTIMLLNANAGIVFSRELMEMPDFTSTPVKETPVTSTAKDIPGPGGEYEVGVEDILDISVIKPKAFASTVTVAPDGAITFPYIGNVNVKGMTLPKIQEEVQKRLADGYMEYPVVSVSLRQTNSKKFTIYGEVVHPGAYPIEENMTLLRAITSAGGFIVPGSTAKVKLLRPNLGTTQMETFEADMMEILSGTNKNLVVRPGDSIVVSVDKFYVYGQVARPGAYPVEANMSLLHAITVAGGFIESGSTGMVKLLHPKAGSDKFKVFESDIKSILNGDSQNVYVRPGDTIVVTVDKYFVYGEVPRPGMYPLDKNTTPLTAIALAGGFPQSGSTGSVKIMRPKADGSDFDVIKSDMKEILNGTNKDAVVHSGDTIVVSADKFYVSGQVLRPGGYPVEENMTLLHAITVAGGFVDADSMGKVKLIRLKAKNEKFEAVETDIKSILGGVNSDVFIHPGDTIVVSADKFFVYGEVQRPGMFPLQANMTALTAIAIAGGYSKFGAASRVKILRMDEQYHVYDSFNINLNEVISGKSRADALLKPGDIVVVSEGAF